MSNKWRLISSGPCDPSYNMALDEAILTAYSKKLVPPTLRVYQWRPYGISLGVSQRAKDVLNVDKCQEDDVRIVRRMTGGQAIFHADEITYSISCSNTDYCLSRLSVKESYRVLTSFIIRFYEKLGLKAGYFCRNAKFAGPASGSSFCFSGREEYDICIRGKKIGGNAQRRMKEKIFQHGSIPINVNIGQARKYFTEDIMSAGDTITSLGDEMGQVPDKGILTEKIADAFREAFQIDLKEGKLIEDEEKLAAELKEKKYGTDEWNFKREKTFVA